MPKKSLTAITIGDINVDLVIDLSRRQSQNLTTQNNCLFEPITMKHGGNATFFAEAALAAGFSNSSLLGAVGVTGTGRLDAAASLIEDRLQSVGVQCHFVKVPDRPTGQVIICYFANDKRTLIADRGANVRVWENDVIGSADHISADLVYVSGYALLEGSGWSPGYLASREKLKLARFTFLDVVPHDVFELVERDDFLETVSGFDGIAFELETLQGFFGDTAYSMLSNKQSIFNKCFRLVIVRLDNISNFLVIQDGIISRKLVPYTGNALGLRFTDRVFAEIIYRYMRDCAI